MSKKTSARSSKVANSKGVTKRGAQKSRVRSGKDRAKKPPTRKEIAERLGVTVPRVSQLADLGMPRDSIDAAEAWYKREIRKRGKAAGREDNKSRVDLECENLELKNRILARKDAEDAGRLLPRSRVREVMSQVIDVQRRGYRKLQSLYAQEYSMSPTERKQWQRRWDQTEETISTSILELKDSLTK